MSISPQVRDFVRRYSVYAEDVDDPTFLSSGEIDMLQQSKLRKQLALVAKTSPYYSNVLRQWSSKLESIDRTTLAGLPVTVKDDLQRDPDAFRLKLDSSDPYNLLWGLVHTTGTTTGKPTPFYDTGHDMFAYWLMLLRTCKIAGITPDDVNVSLMPIPPVSHNAFISSRDACSVLTGRYVAAFVGAKHPEYKVHRGTDYAVSLIEKNRGSVLWGIASYVRHVIARAVELGADFSSVRIVWALGEPCPSPMRDDIRAKLRSVGAHDDTFINNGLGMTEMRGTLVECCELGGCHNPSPDLFLWEVIDPDTHEPKADGEQGHLALTHLDRRGTALVRYMTGDLATMTRQPCPHCGRSGERMLPTIGSAYAVRVSEELKFKGLLIRPVALVDAVGHIAGIGEYQVVFTKEDPKDPFSLDRLVVRVGNDGVAAGEHLRWEETIKLTIHGVSEMRAEVVWVSNRDIFDAEVSVKAKRFVDERVQPGIERAHPS